MKLDVYKWIPETASVNIGHKQGKTSKKYGENNDNPVWSFEFLCRIPGTAFFFPKST